jgi:hypothetical protein
MRRYYPAMSRNDPPAPKRRRLPTLSGWIALVIMAALLIAATIYALHVWNVLAGTQISAHGWLAMALGILFAFGLGVGLMALIFYSSRHNYDQ